MPFRRFRPGAAPRAALVFIAISIWLDGSSQSIAFPILPRLAQALTGDQASAARWVGILEVCWVIPQLVAAPLLGMLSDRFGRRPVILLSIFGVGAEFVLSALAPTIWWLVAARMLCGLTCGAQAASMAYVADVTAPEHRTQAYGWTNAALWTGIIVGPALGGLAAAGLGVRAPFWVAAAVSFAGGVYGLFVLPESLPKERRAPLRWRNASVFGAARLVVERPGLIALALGVFLMWTAMYADQTVVVLYTLRRYGWTALDFGLFCTVAAAGNIAIQGALAGRIARRFGERSTVMLGLALQGVGLAGDGLAPTWPLFCAASVLVAVGNIAGPAVQALMTTRVDASEQGRLQGANAAIGGCAGLFAPVAFAQLYAATIAPGLAMGWSGAVFLVGAFATLAALAVVVGARGPARTLAAAVETA